MKNNVQIDDCKRLKSKNDSFDVCAPSINQTYIYRFHISCEENSKADKNKSQITTQHKPRMMRQIYIYIYMLYIQMLRERKRVCVCMPYAFAPSLFNSS